MTYIGNFYDGIMGDKFTGWTLLIGFDGTLEDVDESDIELMKRIQGKLASNKNFIHKVRYEERA